MRAAAAAECFECFFFASEGRNQKPLRRSIHLLRPLAGGTAVFLGRPSKVVAVALRDGSAAAAASTGDAAAGPRPRGRPPKAAKSLGAVSRRVAKPPPAAAVAPPAATPSPRAASPAKRRASDGSAKAAKPAAEKASPAAGTDAPAAASTAAAAAPPPLHPVSALFVDAMMARSAVPPRPGTPPPPAPGDLHPAIGASATAAARAAVEA